ncbi:MAG: hypothetical protein IPP17_27285 [Bacteroidetes bacterium]|nr:hypothetical protein [Bacteroidota bacterium]
MRMSPLGGAVKQSADIGGNLPCLGIVVDAVKATVTEPAPCNWLLMVLFNFTPADQCAAEV